MLLDYESEAKQAAGNWQKFESFGWHDRPDDCEQWTIVYTCNRDSGLVEQSNAAVIEKVMAPYVRRGWVTEEHHGHWGVGWVDGYAIRVYRPDGRVSRAFKVWANLQAAIESYPLLDEDDHSEREHEAVCEAWENMSLRDRIRICHERGESILAARRERMSDSVYQYVCDRYVN